MAVQALPTTLESESGPGLLGRRALPRVALSLRARLVVAGLPAALPAHTRDLGLRGACIATPTRFAHRDLRRVTLFGPSDEIELTCEGRWQSEVEARDSFITGLFFQDVDEAVQDVIWDLVHERVKELTRWLRQQPALSPLDLEDLLELAHATRVRELRGGQRLYAQGGAGPGSSSLYLVVSGRITLESRSGRGSATTVHELGPGDLLGGVGLLADRSAEETAIAANDANLLEITPATIGYLQQAASAFAVRLAGITARAHLERLRSALLARR